MFIRQEDTSFLCSHLSEERPEGMLQQNKVTRQANDELAHSFLKRM
jgi:hypothetical protein